MTRPTETRAVSAYLTMIDGLGDGRGRPHLTMEELDQRIRDEPDKLRRLGLIQQRMDAERRTFNQGAVDAITDAFLANAAAYGQRKGISYAAWRAVGVSAAVLKEAGITRANGHR